jgi:hypothetical protein
MHAKANEVENADTNVESALEQEPAVTELQDALFVIDRVGNELVDENEEIESNEQVESNKVIESTSISNRASKSIERMQIHVKE